MTLRARFASLVFFWINLLTSIGVIGQNPLRFQNQIDEFLHQDSLEMISPGKIIFTGSSSIRFWKNLETSFADKAVVQRGFGGSEFSDLLFFKDQLIIKHQPTKVVIYSGDNDIASGKSPRKVLVVVKKLISEVSKNVPGVKLYFISPKPSIARKAFNKKYLKLNRKLNRLASSREDLFYVDVWNPMLDENGNVMEDLFIEDGLHMNNKGYAIWEKALLPFL